jgi:signal peptidase I
LENISILLPKRRKESWLAVSFSWIFPGLGQLYAKYYYRSVLFLVIGIGSSIMGITSLLLPNVSYFWSIGIGLINLIGIKLPSCIDSFYVCRRFNLQTLSISGCSDKDPWLSVFLSIVFPGLGHAYLRIYFYSIVYIIVFLTTIIFSNTFPYARLLLPLLTIISSIHAYLVAMKYEIANIRHMIAAWSILILTEALFWIIIPLIISWHVVNWSAYTMGPSMYPTLKNNNKLILNRIPIRYKEPQIGDIVIFKYPVPEKFAKDHPKDKPPILCKRIVAKGGEKVFVKGNDLYVNGEKRVFEIPDISKDENNSNERIRGDNNDFYNKNNCGVGRPYTVPNGQYYVLGDNRSNSLDSRYFGPVSRKLIKGKVIKIYWPLSEMRTLSTNWKDIETNED